MISNVSQSTVITPVSTRGSTPAASTSAMPPAVSASNQGAVTSGAITPVQAGVPTSAVTTTQSNGSDPALAAAVDHLNSNVQNLNRNLSFSVDQDSGKVLVKVVDADTHEVIRQIPSEEALQLARDIDHYMQDHHLGLMKTQA